jgi:predicted glycosyltransferase
VRERIGADVTVREDRQRPMTVVSRRATAPSAPRTPRGSGAQRGPTVLAYSHDGYGLGHLRRNLRLLNGLRRQRPDVRAVLATGARSAERFVAPFSMTCVALPSVVKVANGRYAVDGQAGTLADVMRVRSDALADAVRRYQPELLLVDRYPRGMHEELDAALAAYRAERPGAPAVLGLRDILDRPSVIAREWREQRHSDTIRDLYEVVLCYGDPAVFDSVGEYGLRGDVAERVRFTGYLADELLAAEAGEVRRTHAPGDERLAVCTLGGGKDAAFIAEAFIAAVARLQPSGWSGVLITGPYMAAEDVRRLRAQAAATSVIRMVDHVPDYLAAADAVVCMGGYNTMCEVLALAAPAVVVPRVHPRQEQLMRAERLSARGLVRRLHPASLSPRALARNMQELAEEPRTDIASRVASVAHRGVETSARHLSLLLPPAALSPRSPMLGAESSRHRREVVDASP